MPSDNPFAGRTAVKIISVCDLILAATLLCYYGYKWAMYEAKGMRLAKGPIKVEDLVLAFLRNNYVLIWAAVMFFHSLQLIMSLILFHAAYDRDAEDALGKCQLWWCTSTALFILMGVEAVSMIYLMIGPTGVQPVAMSVFIVKFIFRLTAVVNVRTYMKNLKKAPPTSVHEMVYIRSKTKGPPPSNYIRY